MKIAVLALLTLTLLGACAQNAGIKVAVTPAAIKNFDDNILPIFISKLQTISIPDVSSGKLTISQIVVDKLSLPTNAVVISPGTDDIKLGTQSFGIDVSAHAEMKILFVKISVHVTASCSDSSVLGDVAFDYVNGHPQVSMRDFNVQINHLDIKFGSSIIDKAASAIINLFRGTLQNMIAKAITSTVRNTLGDAINKAIDRIPNNSEIKKTPLSVSYELIAAPVITPNYITVSVDGCFYETNAGKVTPPITPAGPMPDYDATAGSQVQLFLNQFVLDSGLYSAWHAGMLQKSFNATIFDSSANFKFNIEWLKQFISQIAQYFALDVLLELDVSAKNAPLLTLKKDNIELGMVVEIGLSAIVDGNKMNIFTADCNIDLNTTLSVENWVLEPKVTGGSFQTMNVTSSTVGEIVTDLMIAGLNEAAAVAIPKIDFSIAAIPLPSSLDVDMSTISLAVQDGYIQIDANPVFKPY